MASVHKQMTRNEVSRPGFTMVEIMVAASISLVVFAMAFAAMIRFSRVHYSLATQADMDREFRYALNWITDDFRGLNGIEIEELTQDEIEEGEFPEVMLSLPSIENDKGEMPDRTEVTYKVGEDDVLRRLYVEYDGSKVLNTQNTLMLKDISEFAVARAGGSSTFNLTLGTSRQAGGDDYEKTVTTRIASRN